MKKICLLLLSTIMCATACNSTSPEKKAHDPDNLTYYEGKELHYLSSDGGFDNFINDFTHRNMRYDDNSVGIYPVAHGTGFAKNWESMAVMFQNSSKEAYGEDKISEIYNFLNAIPQNDQGMIYNTSGRDSYVSVEGENCPHGWPFPTWKDSTENYKDAGALKAVHTTAFEFNSKKEKQSAGWKVENGNFEVTDYGYATFSTNGESPLRFYKDDLSTLLPKMGGIDTNVAALIEYDISFTSRNLEDFYIIFKTKDDDSWHKVSQSIYNTEVIKSYDSFSRRAWLQMYLSKEWNNKVVTAIGVEFSPKEGKSLTINDGIINYLRPSYDTRQSNATYQWILALYNYYQYTQNISKVSDIINKARRAISFLNHTLEGEKGLLNISYLHGHNCTPMYKNNDVWFRDPANGVGNGYWDLLAPSEINLEANIYYYQSLVAMSKLEKALEKEGIAIDSNVSIINRIPGDDVIYYDYNSSSLMELANVVKTNIEKDIKVTKDSNGLYKNTGGFYNPVTGRFASGINEKTGEIMDYGYVYWNEEAIAAGLGTDAQQKLIMSWINGDRIVEGDKSTGKDIYFYEFAPRFCTKDTTGAYSGFALPTLRTYENNMNIGVDQSWSRQLQNGGAAIAWSYYDIVCRANVLGSDNALSRLKEIETWYKKVSKEKMDDGLYFYEGYYNHLDELNQDTDMYGYYSIQNSSLTGNGAGALGLNGEFIESVIFIRSLPDAFMGLNGSEYHTLSLTNNLPGKLSFLQSDNLKFIKATYSLKVTKDTIQVFDIKGEVAPDIKISFKFKTDKINPIIKINDEISDNFVIKDGYGIITTPFTNVKVTIN